MSIGPLPITASGVPPEGCSGIDKNGKIHVNNPNKGKKEGAFTPAQIEDARVNYYIFDKKK